MDIRKHLFLLLLFCCSTISLAIQRDSITIDPRWNYWSIDATAPTGNWIVSYQIYPNDYNKGKGFVVHTETKKKIDVTGINTPQFTNNNFLIGKKVLETVEFDLMTQKEISLGMLKKQDWIGSIQTLCFINEKNQLILRKYEKKGAREDLKIDKISTYIINPSKTQLLYQKEGETVLYHLDLKTLKVKSLLDLKESFSGATWNFSEDVISTVLQNKNILLVDLNKGSYKTIELPKEELSIDNVWCSFFSNNDLFISYEALTSTPKDPVTDYLDIWNGNDRELKYKTSGMGWGESGVLPAKIESETKVFVYQSSKDKLAVLSKDAKQKFLNIGIPNYLLIYEPLELQDYLEIYEKVRYRLFQIDKGNEIGELTTASLLGNYLNRSPNSRYIVYPKDDIWEVYDFERHERIPIPQKEIDYRPLWSDDSKFIYYQDGQNLLEYTLQTGKVKRLTNLKGSNRFSIENAVGTIDCKYINSNYPLIFFVRHPDNKTSYCSWFKNKLTNIVNNTSNKLNTQYLNRGIANDGQTIVWTEENYNQPHMVKLYREGKVSTLLEAAVPEELYSWRKQKVIHYKDKYGVDLTGVLWYPKDFNPSKKYPMVTWIYERQSGVRSEFEIPTIYSENGFNRTVLNEQGYFVFQPDTYTSAEGSGLSALECVTKGIDNITSIEPSIDKVKLGLMGHSFGGYKTSFILGNSKLFATGVSGAGIHDLVNYYYEYNYMLKMPNWSRVEGPQQDLIVSFGDNPTKYYKNSPIHFAQNFEAPVLLWTGMKDDNVHWEQTRHMYIALKRYQKPVITLFYIGEGHGLRKRKAKFDLTYRVLDWFDFYLKGKQDKEWIARGVNYNEY